MHTSFADWLRSVRPEIDSSTVLGRWEIVEAVSNELSPANLLPLLHFASTSVAPPSFFVDAVQKVDAAFPIRDNAAEFRLLAASALLNIISTNAPSADAAALAFVCLHSGGLRGLGPIAAALSIAERHLFERGRDLRVLAPPDRVGDADLKRPLAELTAALPSMAQNGFGPLGEFLSKLVASHSALPSAVDRAVDSLYADVSTLREQLDIVWWVFGGRLSDGRPFANVALPELTLLLANDLAEMTAVIPGPVAIRGYIRFALQNGRGRVATVSLRQAIDAMDTHFLSAFESRPPTRFEEFTCVASYGLHRRHATGNQAWNVGFQQETDVQVSKKIEAEDLAYQFYSERLLVRELGDMQS